MHHMQYIQIVKATLDHAKAELVGVDEAMTFVIWKKHIFESQVIAVNVNSPLKPL